MFARDKRIGPYTYVYLVENVREEGRTKQRSVARRGRKEVVVARGDLDRLARSVVRLAQRSMVLSLVEGEAPPNARCQRIGPALLFERLWHASRSQRADAALPQGPRGRGAVCPSARPVRRTQRRLHGHHQPVLRGAGRRGAWASRPFERPQPGL